jgi:murein DD-endopeptidase MepM/ murein hydrolase activator NlpD
MNPRSSRRPRRPGSRRRTRSVAALVLGVAAVVAPIGAAVAAVATGTAGSTGPTPEPRGEWPLRPAPSVVRGFDPPEVQWGSGHRGVDLAGTIGQRVHAALAGRVSFVGSVAGVDIVVVDHGATRTTYQPVGALVRVGEHVGAGEVLGRLEWFGTHCLPTACLHWGLLEGDRYLDPLTLVGAGPRPVRLLPLDVGATSWSPLLSPVVLRPQALPSIPPW